MNSGRNDLCPCGSNKKYKRCCGAGNAHAITQVVPMTPVGHDPIQKPTAISQLLQRALAYQQGGQLHQAEVLYEKVLSIQPRNVDALHWRGVAASETGRLDEAEALIRKAIKVKPVFPEAHNALGGILKSQGRLEEAATCYRRALALNPNFAYAHYNLGCVFQSQGQLREAVSCYQRSLDLEPSLAIAHCNLGNILRDQGHLGDAAESYRRALHIKPEFHEVYFNLAAVLYEQGYPGALDEVVACFRQALLLKPMLHVAHSGLLFAMNYHSQYSPAQCLAEACFYGRKVMEQAKPYSWCDAPTYHAPLRVGLVSGDLRTHPVGFFMESLLAHLNTDRVELVAYTTNQWESDLTTRIKPHFAAWNTIAGLSDEAAARKIHEDGINILIDLAGHTGGNRLPVFAWKPAPVQVSWLGYFATTGVPGMDYLLADPVSVPAHHREHFTEAVWYLPDTRLCFTPPAVSAKLETSPPPGLSNGLITFGCFQNLTKVNDGVLAIWGKIFQALPQARLRLQSKQVNCSVTREHLQRRLAEVGITPEKVTLEGGVPREVYLEAYAEVDIILDTFPFPGGTTTCEALWMGVPTMTIAGGGLLARQGASLLACVGLEDWIASDEADYVTRIIAYATDIDRLAKLRSTLRSRLLASPICDAPLFARNLEDAFMGMWKAYIGKYDKSGA